MFRHISFLILAAIGGALFAAPPAPLLDYAGLYDFDTVAGSPMAGMRNNDLYSEGGRFDLVSYRSPSAIISYPHGEIVADTANGVLRSVDSFSVRYLLDSYELTGEVTHPKTLFFSAPSGLALAPNGVLYIAESGSHRIHRYVLPTDFKPGRLTLFAGGAAAGHVNASGRVARFSTPTALAADQAGNVFVADTGNHVIRKISPAGAVTTLAGSPGKIGAADGKGALARFASPRGIATDPAGNVYVSDTGNHLVRVITPDGRVSTLAGLAGVPGAQNGRGADARFSSPRGLHVRSDGGLVVADSGNHLIRLVSAYREVSTLAGTPGVAGGADGPAGSATFSSPADLTIRPDGTILIVDTGNHRLRAFSPSGNITTHSGLPAGPGFEDGIKKAARLNQPAALSVTTDGLFFTDYGNQALRRLSWADHAVTTVAEIPVSRGGGLATSSDGGVCYLTDPDRHTLRSVDLGTGEISVVAGTAETPGAADGTAPLATFNSPRGIAVSQSGQLYIADSANHTIRRFDPASGEIDTVAGQAGQPGSTDGAATAAATLRTPWALAFGADGTLYVLERDSGSIRTLATDGTIGTRYLDAGKRLDKPTTLAVDSDGNIVVGDSRNRLFILPRNGELGSLLDDKLGAGGEDDWLIRYDNNQTIDTARVDHPEGLAFGPGDTLYIADTGNSTLRRGRPPMHNLPPGDLRVDNIGHDIAIEASAPVVLVSPDLPSAVHLYGPDGNRLYSRFYRFFPSATAVPGVYPCTLRAELHDYTRTRSLALQVLPSDHQHVSLRGSYFSYDGSPKTPEIFMPEGLTLTSVLYDGLPTPPTEGGRHIVRVTYSANGATGTKDLEMFISQADYPRITIPSGPFVADGQPFNPLAGQPFGEAGTWHVQSGPARIENHQVVLFAPGEVSLSYSLPDTPNYCIGGASGTIQAVASPSSLPANIVFGGLETTYDGQSKSVTVTTEPPGLDVNVRYSQYLQTPPSNAGQYQVEAFVTTPGYSGYARATQNIAKATATLTAAPLPAFVYNGQPYRPNITTAPDGLQITLRIDGQFHNGDFALSPGVHTITVEAAGWNYEPVEPVTFTQTVFKRPLTIRPLPAHRPVGAPNPEIRFAFDGLLSGVTQPTMPAPVILAGPDSPPGVYAVKPGLPAQGLGSLKYYYDITLLNGTLEVHAHKDGYQTLLIAQGTGLPEALLTLKLHGPAGAFTGTLRYRDESFPLLGRFAYSDTGTAVAYWRKPYEQPAHRERDRLRLDLTLSGSLHAVLTSYAEIKRAPVSDQPLAHSSETDLVPLLNASGRPSVSFAGDHTLLLRGAQNLVEDAPLPPVPHGPGYATGKIGPRGLLTLRGMLGDGQPFTTSLLPDEALTYRVFANPYGRPASYFSGWLPLQPHPTLEGRRYLPAGDEHELYWAKTPSRADFAYRNGFGPLSLHATLDPWRFFTEEISFTGYPTIPYALVSNTASMSVAPMDIDRRSGLFRMQATLHDPQLSASLGIPELTTRRFTIKGILRQAPSPEDNVVGAGLILLPAPGLITKEAFTGQLLLKD